MQVFVLLFNARTENEGIHTLQTSETIDGKTVSRDVVLGFETEEDATRFALLLEAQDFPTATVEELDLEEIQEFCQSSNLVLKLVPEGTLAVPPEANLDRTDWQPDSEVPPELDLDRVRRQLEDLL